MITSPGLNESRTQERGPPGKICCLNSLLSSCLYLQAVEVERAMSNELRALKQELQQKGSHSRLQDEELISAMREQVNKTDSQKFLHFSQKGLSHRVHLKKKRTKTQGVGAFTPLKASRLVACILRCFGSLRKSRCWGSVWRARVKKTPS